MAKIKELINGRYRKHVKQRQCNSSEVNEEWKLLITYFVLLKVFFDVDHVLLQK